MHFKTLHLILNSEEKSEEEETEEEEKEKESSDSKENIDITPKTTATKKRALLNASKVTRYFPCFASNGRRYEAMIAHASREQIYAIGEVALNILEQRT